MYHKASGAYDKEVGRTMAIWAYAGVFAGTLALYKYLDLFDKDKKKLSSVTELSLRVLP